MIFEDNNIINVYNLRFFSSIRTHSHIANNLCSKYLIKKKKEFECLHIEKIRFFAILQKQELIEQNDNVVVYPAAKCLLASVIKHIFVKNS